MSSTRDLHNVEDTYEAQNDQRLDELHSKIRTLRGITTDINDDVERQNLTLDDTSGQFASFGDTLTQTSRRASQAFGLGPNGLKIWHIGLAVVSLFSVLWIVRKVVAWAWP